MGVGIAAGESDILSPVSLTGLNAVGKVFKAIIAGTYAVGVVLDYVKLGIDVSAVATTLVGEVTLIGILIPV